MAIDIYSILSMSSELKRVFSGAKHAIPSQRSSLLGETTELLDCLKSWVDADIFT